MQELQRHCAGYSTFKGFSILLIRGDMSEKNVICA